jgi:hypothetical protein
MENREGWRFVSLQKKEGNKGCSSMHAVWFDGSSLGGAYPNCAHLTRIEAQPEMHPCTFRAFPTRDYFRAGYRRGVEMLYEHLSTE